ncbi:ribbon-helix-helix protein, CopG family [Patulibacter minatonensis]|uniref:ribbon-helix-helix protein, CopG family n=1 Tax=Patulibacter minatonensis TaxID=298163 RepID=UPI000564CD90|nr:ribbon-helix-helix protein, CopG family [Patulibacter minatonensis]
MAVTLRLTDDETEALRRRAERESRSMQEVARQAIRARSSTGTSGWRSPAPSRSSASTAGA